MQRLIIGLMSGTSLDGVDAVLARFDDAPESPQKTAEMRTLASHHLPMPQDLRSRLLLLQAPAANELHEACLAANDLARLYAQCVAALLQQAAIAPSEICLLGAHGQTVRHQPAQGYTVQLLNAALLAELSGIRVAYDFRSRDIAASGQGAPLVPAFHAGLFAHPGQTRAIVNIGGISNITVLPAGLAAGDPVVGFDCGPGNVLLDAWFERHQGGRFDRNGDWAAGAQPDRGLLEQLLQHPYFARPWPKSTGRDDFHMAWLEQEMADFQRRTGKLPNAQSVQATLTRFTAHAIAGDCQRAKASEVFLCGGGALNLALTRALGEALGSNVRLSTTAELGIPVDQVEALAFAWLAYQSLEGKPGNLPGVTGARGLRVLGSTTN